MTPYQRGNRDGLLSLADRLGDLAVAEDDQRRRHGGQPRLAYLVEHHTSARDALRRAETLARQAAEALPDDPEGAPATCTLHCDARRTADRAEIASLTERLGRALRERDEAERAVDALRGRP